MSASVNTPRSFSPDDREIIRAKINDIRRTEAVTLKTLSAQSGIATSTLSQILNSNYQGNEEQFFAALSDWLEAKAKSNDILAKIGGKHGFVNTKTSNDISSVLAYCLSAQDMGAVIGAPGVGKSETAKNFARRNPRVLHITATPLQSGPRHIMNMLCLKAMIVRSRDMAYNRSQLEEYLSGAISMVILDEAQHCSFQALEELRSIHDVTGCGLVLMGNNKVSESVSGSDNGKLAQFTSRVGMNTSIFGPRPEEDVMPLLDELGVTGAPERAFLRQVANSHGALRKMVKVLRFARINRADDAPEDTLLADLKRAAAVLNVNFRGAV